MFHNSSLSLPGTGSQCVSTIASSSSVVVGAGCSSCRCSGSMMATITHLAFVLCYARATDDVRLVTGITTGVNRFVVGQTALPRALVSQENESATSQEVSRHSFSFHLPVQEATPARKVSLFETCALACVVVDFSPTVC